MVLSNKLFLKIHVSCQTTNIQMHTHTVHMRVLLVCFVWLFPFSIANVCFLVTAVCFCFVFVVLFSLVCGFAHARSNNCQQVDFLFVD